MRAGVLVGSKSVYKNVGPVILKFLALWWKSSAKTVGNVIGNKISVIFLAYVILLYRSIWWNERESTPLESLYWERIKLNGNYFHTVLAANVILSKYLFAKTLRALAVAFFVFKRVWVAPLHAANFMERTSAALQDGIKDRVERFLDKRIDFMGGKVKILLKDQDMPLMIQDVIDDFVDLLLPDIKLALFNHTDTLLQKRFLSKTELNRRFEAVKEGSLLDLQKQGNLDLESILEDIENERAPLATSSLLPESDSISFFSQIIEYPRALGDNIYNRLPNKPWGRLSSATTTEIPESSEIHENSSFFTGWFSSGWLKKAEVQHTCPHCGLITNETSADDDLNQNDSANSLNLSIEDVSSEINETVVSKKMQPRAVLMNLGASLVVTIINVARGSVQIVAVFHLTWFCLVQLRRNLIWIWLHVPSWTQIKLKFAAFRGFILYTVSPYNRSFWQSLKNPVYLGFIGLGLIPNLGLLWWFFLFILHDKRDEHQLCQFVVGFQTAKFFSQGLYGFFKGSFQYYVCANRNVSTCDVDGPSVSSELAFVLFVFQVTIVLVTFFLVRYSEPCKNVAKPEHAYLLDIEGERRDRNRTALKAKARLGKGGRLNWLFAWYSVATFLVLFLSALCYIFEQENWQMRASLYWTRSIYGILAFPFIFFKLPLMGGLLTAARSTGYTRDGETVLRISMAEQRGNSSQRSLVEEFLKRVTESLASSNHDQDSDTDSESEEEISNTNNDNYEVEEHNAFNRPSYQQTTNEEAEQR